MNPRNMMLSNSTKHAQDHYDIRRFSLGHFNQFDFRGQLIYHLAKQVFPLLVINLSN